MRYTPDTDKKDGQLPVMSPETAINMNLRILNGLKELNQLVRIRGIYCTPTNRQTYAWAGFKGIENSVQIRLYFSERENNMHIFNQLVPQQEYVLTGYISVYSGKEALCFQLTPVEINVDTLEGNKAGRQWGKDTVKLKEWLCEKKQNRTRDLQGLVRERLKSRGVVTAILIRPKSETAEKDIVSAMGGVSGYYNIKPYGCDFTNPEAIASALRKVDLTMADLILLSRGGGENLDVLDDMQVIEALNNIKSPLVTGLGHAGDHLLAELFADHICSTPSMVGVYLKQLYMQANQEKEAYVDIQDERNETAEKNKKTAVNRYLNPIYTFYGIPWTNYRPIKYLIWILCLTGLYQAVRLFL